ncbi:MAG TPA: aminotransferase class I/II-fold pyridoxal phosphate-dependent enzyme [Thermoanaerobaculia bacterium]|nr:aminotransferase class I/II-fold pyridoxal phosphate-dependent enzyme [Thermoanaerobaculia bacterium]
MDLLERENAALRHEVPALWQALSPPGRRAGGGTPAHRAQPAASARPAEPAPAPAQATRDRVLAAPPPLSGAALPHRLAAALAGLPGGAAGIAAALGSAPATGWPELRRAWRERQRQGVAAALPSSLPVVTAGLSHGLSLVADLFGGLGKAVAVPEPFWGSYRQTFGMCGGGRLLTAPAYREGRFDPLAAARPLADLPEGEPAVVLVNLPSNPGGYSPTAGERRQLTASLLAAADRRPLVVVCDDAYAGLVYEPEVPRGSLFWELAGAHPNLVPVKVDGATKEVCFFGGRVGFLTFAVEPGSAAAGALETKVGALLRSGVGAAPSASQAVLLAALGDAGLEAQMEDVRQLLAARFRVLRETLAAADRERLATLPFNAGCFALVEVPARLGLGAGVVRRHLLERWDVGLVSIAPRYLRIAHCSVAADALPEMVRRLEAGIGELAAAGSRGQI